MSRAIPPQRRFGQAAALLIVALGGAAALAGCGTSTARADVFGIIDSFIEPDGPKPWFRDGGCGPGGSGISGGCGDAGPPIDARPNDLRSVDLPKPDVCIPPASWDCELTFTFDKQGSETTGGVHGDWDVFDGTTFTTKSATLNGNQWLLVIKQPHGKTLTYKFVVDKDTASVKWFVDPNNPKQVPDGFGSFNSQLDISCPNPCQK